MCLLMLRHEDGPPSGGGGLRLPPLLTAGPCMLMRERARHSPKHDGAARRHEESCDEHELGPDLDDLTGKRGPVTARHA